MNSEIILRALKLALKRKNLTYRELGAKLGLTEAAIKKQFQSSDISFNRIIQVCEILEISIHALFEAVKSNPIRELKLTQAQQSYFLKQPESFLFFLRLSDSAGNADQANTDFAWSETILWKNLKSLDDLGLIRLHKGKRVELIYGSLLTITTQGTPMYEVTQKLGIKFLEKLQTSNTDGVRDLKISLLRLSKENIEKLKQDLEHLYREKLRQSEIDKVIFPESDLKTCSLMLAVGEFSFV